jgi:D-alanine-D-alanine ligase
MSSTISFLPSIPLKRIKIWVLAPSLQTNDAHLDYYYDFSQSIAEYTKTFALLELEWKWQPVTIDDYAQVISAICREKEEGHYLPIVFNICDGDEVNGTPGISVVKLLHQSGLIYTGADEYFYAITTSKIPMKEAFDKAGVPNAPWETIFNKDQQSDGIFNRLGVPIIVKPSVSGGSMGVGIKNVVYNEKALKEQLIKMFNGYRGWNLSAGGIIAESFITGPEYTVLIAGSHDNPDNAKIYTPVERIFHPSLPDKEKFLSFDRLWEIYEEEEAMPNEGNFYEYALPDAGLINEIKKISWDAFVACRGKGYTRVDVRMDSQSKKMYVLEVNAQCGISEDENYTSIGAILRMNNKTFTELVIEIINDAFIRGHFNTLAEISPIRTN